MKRNALLIGAFVLAALAMSVIGVLWLSGNNLFKKQQEAMIFYKGNASGLYVGAPVGFRGVTIGQVERIGIEVDPTTLKALVPVRIRLQGDALRVSGKKGEPIDIAALVQRGLRARLVAQSFVTGQKSIELDFVPNTPATLVGGDTTRPEIPALGDRFGALIDQVAELPLRETVQEIRDTVKELRGTLVSVQNTLDGTQKVLVGVSGEITKSGTESRVTLQAATEAIRQVQANSATTLASITRLADAAHGTLVAERPDLQRTLASTREAAEAAQLAMTRVAEMTAPNATLRADLDSAMRDLSQAARGLRDWSELLEEKPNAIIFGSKRE
ncbi:MAG: MCE family protein [Burkholderiales bacterium]|nr:MCE family protein [Burkholderiales bacterium]MDE2628179.1 MCE family protein [Burkholderiales bacterium]